MAYENCTRVTIVNSFMDVEFKLKDHPEFSTMEELVEHVRSKEMIKGDRLRIE